MVKRRAKSRNMGDVYRHLVDDLTRTMESETLKPRRRSHLKRRAMKKGVVITERDIHDIFEPLSRHAQLTTSQLVAYGRRYPTITKARLGELWHATSRERIHWLHRLNEDIVFANHLVTEDFHRIGVEAELLIQTQGIVPNEDWVAATKIGGRSTAPSRIIRLAHDHMVSEIVLDIEIGARARGISFQSHLDILRDAPEATRAAKRPLQIPVTLNGQKSYVEPDALFAIGNQVYALEVDRGTESVRSVIAQKIIAYREIVAACVIDEWLGIDKLTVLFAVPNETRMKSMMRELEQIAHNGKSAMFGFRVELSIGSSSRNAARVGQLADAQWKRVGFDEFSLTDC